MKVGILYICTGKYIVFWEEFYKSCQKYFLSDSECVKQYYVFTDVDKIYQEDVDVNIHRFYEGGNLAASKIRNLECPNYEICLIDYGCGKFNRKIHIMEQYP